MSDQPHYPYRDGDHAVLGPDVIATADGMTICWKGAKYRRDHGEAAPVATQATVPATITDPEYLRQQYTAIISALHDNRPDHIAAELLRVHGRHLAQVRQRLQLADELLATRDAELAAAKKTARGIGAWGVLQAIEQALPQGPTVAEAAADDARHWNDKYAGEGQ